MVIKLSKWIKLIGPLVMLVLVGVWFMAFFFPNLVAVNRLKREIKDLRDQVTLNIDAGGQFEYPDETELDRLKQADWEMQKAYSEVNNPDDFLRLVTRTAQQLKELAAQQGVTNLIVSSNSRDLEINAQALPDNRETLNELIQFATTRLRDATNGQEQREKATDHKRGPFGLSSHPIFVTFKGTTRNAMFFLHHLPASARSLRIEKMVVSEGLAMPLFLIHARLYFWEPLKKAPSHPSQESAGAQE